VWWLSILAKKNEKENAENSNLLKTKRILNMEMST